jgi:hypothetical protein
MGSLRERASIMISSRRMRLILLVGSAVPLTVSLFSSRYLVADNLGVFSSLSWLFYVAVGMVLVGLAMNAMSRHRNRLVHLLALLEITTFFLAAGVIVGGPGMIANQFVGVVIYFEGVNFIHTHTIQSIAPYFPQIGGWPAPTGFFGLLLSSMGILNPPLAPEDLILIQILLAFIDVALFFCLAERLLGENSNGFYAASATFVILGRLTPSIPNDIGFSYTMFLALCLILFSGGKQKTVLWFLVFLVIALSNFYASLMAMAISTVYSVYTRKIGLFSIGSTVIVVWLLLGPPGGYTSLARSSLLSVLNWGAILNRFVAATSEGSYSHRLIVFSQIALYIIVLTFGIVALIYEYFRRGPKRLLVMRLMSFVCLMLLVTFVFGPAFGEDPLESLQRSAYFTLPFLLGISFVSANRRVLVALPFILLLATPVSLIALYGPVVNNYVGQPEMQAGRYLQNSYYSGLTILNLVPNYYAALGDTIYYLTAPNLIFSNLSMRTVIGSQLFTIEYPTGSSFILSIGRQTSILFQTVGNWTDYRGMVAKLNSTTDVVYDSGDVQEYFLR